MNLFGTEKMLAPPKLPDPIRFVCILNLSFLSRMLLQVTSDCHSLAIQPLLQHRFVRIHRYIFSCSCSSLEGKNCTRHSQVLIGEAVVVAVEFSHRSQSCIGRLQPFLAKHVTVCFLYSIIARLQTEFQDCLQFSNFFSLFFQ